MTPFLAHADLPPRPRLRCCIAAAPSLGECFALFELVHTLTTNHEAMTRLTREAMEDYRADGVFYLELRTTPKVGWAGLGWL